MEGHGNGSGRILKRNVAEWRSDPFTGDGDTEVPMLAI